MSRRYFGTDGIRGRVGEFPLTPGFALHLGWAAGRIFARENNSDERACVVIGKDTRLSGYMFESALEAGFSAAGVDVLLVGPMPTPAIAYLARTFRAAAGVVISASHNPFYDNGVKFFSSAGQKLPDAMEMAIEDYLERDLETVSSAELGRASRIESAPGRYIEFCKSTFQSRHASLSGLSLVVDCAHGATYHVAPHVFRELGADVTTIGVEPDGLNINKDCGSTKTASLRHAVVEHAADAGVALDGDGDRCIMVDDAGTVVDGDQLLYAIAMDRQAGGTLRSPVVGTQMSNLGLALALAREGIQFERAAVGDRYVFERLQATDGLVGGESSGHILCLDRASTGDGIVSSLQVLGAMVARDIGLRQLVGDMDQCPQALVNVPVVTGTADTIMVDVQVVEAVKAVENELGDQGRVLLRASGTEPLIRVMVEALDANVVQTSAERIAECVRNASNMYK